MYIIYKTTNLINNKFYIGMHITDNLDDNYLGSGIWLNHAIQKYGRDSFRKEILHVCESKEQMYNLEKLLVETYKENPFSYNIMKGGKGGWDSLNEEFSQGKRVRYMDDKNHPMNNPATIKKRNNTLYKKYGNDYYNQISKKGIGAIKEKYNLSHVMDSPIIKEIHQKSLPDNHQKGSANSQYGKTFKFVTNGIINKKVETAKLAYYIQNGYVLGRIGKS